MFIPSGVGFPLAVLIAIVFAEATEHPCTVASNCTCKSLRDSDCYCGMMNTSRPTICNCSLILEECWTSHSYVDYGLGDECSKGSSSPISVVLHTTSLSSEGISAMKLFKKAMEVADKWIDFKIIFLLDHINYWPDITTITDSPEIQRDELILCANYIDPTARHFFPYLYCLGLNDTAGISSTHVRDCAIEHGYSYEELESCVEENGQDLLGKDLIHAIKDTPDPTVVLDHSQILLLNNTATVKELLREVCYVIANPTNNYSFPFWIFTLLSCCAISVVLVLWVVRKPTSQILDSLMQLFFESAFKIDEEPAELALRRWRDGRIQENVFGEQSLLDDRGLDSVVSDSASTDV